VEPREQLAAVLAELAAVPDGQPVVMLNLLRFRDQADYPPGSGIEPAPDPA
jgi:hypothetical protein